MGRSRADYRRGGAGGHDFEGGGVAEEAESETEEQGGGYGIEAGRGWGTVASKHLRDRAYRLVQISIYLR